MSAPTPTPALPPVTTSKVNPNWVSTIVASLLLALLLKVALHIPFLTTFITIGVIYIMGVVKAQMAVVGSSAGTVWQWIKNARNVMMGVVVFLALRFLAAGVLGLYLIDTYSAVDSSGGLFGILPGRDTSKVILWEMTFAFFAGQLTKMWVQGTHKFPVRAIIVGSWFILSLQIAFPKYVSTFLSRAELDQVLATNGLRGTFFPKKSPATPPAQTVATPPAATVATKTLPPGGKLVVQMPDVHTPCTINITNFHSLIIWEPVYMLPPNWHESRAIYYSGKGDLKLQGGHIPSGEWKFWSADTNNVSVRIRVFTRQ